MDWDPVHKHVSTVPVTFRRSWPWEGRRAGGGKQQPAGTAGRDVAVTSVREVALSKEHASVLRWTGTVMLGMSSLLFVLLLSAW